MAGISLEGVTKVYPDGTPAVSALDLEVPDGSFMVLVGPSGCGKTTALMMVAGLEEVTEGTIRVGDRVVNDVEARDRDIAMVFQSYALYPHMSVYRNMAFGLKMRKIDREEIDRRVRSAAHMLELPDDLLQKKPKQLSGGQRQRVAMGRAIVRQPQAFLMDEPLSNLDAQLRVEMRAEISALQRDLGVTTIYVTHDQTEALTLGDSVAVMRDGVLQQVAPPQEVYARPANTFVAGFVGSPPMNLIGAEVSSTNDGVFVEFGSHRLRVDADHDTRSSLLGATDHRDVIAGIRAEDMHDASLEREGKPDHRMTIMVEHRESMGPETHVHFRVPLTENGHSTDLLQTTQDSDGQTMVKFVARVDSRTHVHDRDEIELVVDTSAMQFFDPDSGERL